MREEWDERFRMENEELLNKLKTGNEMERLYALAKLEEKCYGNGFPGFLIDLFIEHAQNDESPIVRAFALRALYHQSSETWPMEPEDRKKVLNVIKDRIKWARENRQYTFDTDIAYELNEIETCVKWLFNHLYWKMLRH